MKNKKIEKINQKIKRPETIERINIKEETKLVKRIKADIIDETKALEDIGTILRNVKTAILKKYLEWNWWARNTEKKNRSRKTKKSK